MPERPITGMEAVAVGADGIVRMFASRENIAACSVCRKTDDCRPYGVDGSQICPSCFESDPQAIKRCGDIICKALGIVE